MKNTKADRRSQRTRQLLSSALVDLMLQKRYDEITVQNIIDRANVGRSTFYAHYLDKDDLLVSDFCRSWPTTWPAQSCTCSNAGSNTICLTHRRRWRHCSTSL